MRKFKVGDKVVVNCSNQELEDINIDDSVTTGDVGIIQKVGPYDCFIIFDEDKDVSWWLMYDMIERVRETEDKPKVKPKVTLMTSGRRQFDSTFKLEVVRKAAEIRRKKQWGGLTKLLKEYRIDAKRLSYWEKQHQEGHFSSNRAVAFSRRATMVHG